MIFISSLLLWCLAVCLAGDIVAGLEEFLSDVLSGQRGATVGDNQGELNDKYPGGNPGPAV